MSDGLYVAMNGAMARSEQLDAISDNLANAQTTGFKAARPAFQVFQVQDGAVDQVHTAAVATGFDLRAGVTNVTGNGLDVAPEGDAFLAVRAGNGSLAFTRNGRLDVSGDGTLRAAGHQVLGRDGQPIVIPPMSLPSVTTTGEVRVNDQTIGQLAFFRLQGSIDRVGSSLLVPGAGGRADGIEGRVQVGALESSNVSALDCSIEMISAQRHYETSMQAIETYRRLDTSTNAIGKVG